MLEVLQVILDILWTLLKIGVTVFLVCFVWDMAIGMVRKLREERKHD